MLDASADATEPTDAIEIDAPPPLRCTGAFREVERTTVAAHEALVPHSIFSDGSLWFSVERTDNTGTASYDSAIGEARGWGGAPSAAYVIPPARNEQRVRFVRSNSGLALARLQGQTINLRSRAVVQLGAGSSIDRFALSSTETWWLDTTSPTEPAIVRFAPATVAPAPPPAQLGRTTIPLVPTTQSALYRSPNGQRAFVLAGAGSDQFVRVFDDQLRPVGGSVSVSTGGNSYLPLAAVSDAGLWLLVQRDTDSRGPHELRHINNEGSSRIVTITPMSSSLAPAIEAVADDFIVLRTNWQLELRSLVDGSVRQVIAEAMSATLHDRTLFVFDRPAGPLAGSTTITIRRMVCN